MLTSLLQRDIMAASVVLDGPVLSLLNNRIQALQIELGDPISQGKPTISAVIHELQNLRQPLSSALAQELLQQPPNEVLFRNYASFQMQVEGTSISQSHDPEKIVTDSGHASILAATDAATPTLRQIERAAITAATPITNPPRDFLLLIHKHLLAYGLLQTASMLLKEAQLEPLPSLVAQSSLVQQPFTQEAPPVQYQWPSGRVPGVLFNELKLNAKDKDAESQYETPIILPMKHKLSELMDIGVLSSSEKRLNVGDLGFHSPICPTPSGIHKSSLQTDTIGLSRPSSNLRNQQGRSTAEYVDESQCSKLNLGQVTPASLVINHHQPNDPESMSLDTLVVHYLKHQHHQSPTPISILPPLSLSPPHVCPKPKRSLHTPCNVTSRLATREFESIYDGVHGKHRDRQFVYSRFRPSRGTFRSYLLSCMTFLGDCYIALGDEDGDIQLLDSSEDGLETYDGHEYPLTLIQSFVSGDSQLLLSSSSIDVKLWDVSPLFRDYVFDLNDIHLFDGCKAARFSNSGNVFAALSVEPTQCEILLYDIQTCQLASKFSDTSATFTGRDDFYSLIHFNHSDSMLLWNGILWDRRVSEPVHRFHQFTDFRGGGFHPGGNEVITNSEVWDLRKFRLLCSVPSLDQTTISFNAGGDVIYAILRRNMEDIMSAFYTCRVRHPLFSAFRTVDAVSYSDIATIPADNCVLDFTTDPTDSYVGLLTMPNDEYEEDEDDMHGSVRIYEIGGVAPTP